MIRDALSMFHSPQCTMVDSYSEQEFQVPNNGDSGFLLESLITQKRAFISEKCQNFQVSASSQLVCKS